MRCLAVHLAAALALTLMTVAANAQASSQQTQMNSASRLGQSVSKDMDDKKGGSTTPKAIDKAYNAALKNLPDKQYDPWRGVR